MAQEFTHPKMRYKPASVPENASQLRASLGMVNYYNKFISQTTTHLAPLYELLEKHHVRMWTEECDKDFQDCKDLLTGKIFLSTMTQTNSWNYVSCDASQYGVGAVLSHITDKEEQPIAFASWTLSKAEKNYGQIEKEALVLVFEFYKYLFGCSFIMITDHKPLLSILNAKTAIPSMAAARMQQWGIFLSAYQYEIECGKQHANSEGLSRLPIQGSTELQDPVSLF